MDRVRHLHPGQLARPVQPRQRDGVAPVRRDPLTRPLRDQGRRDHGAVVAEFADLPIQPVARRPGLEADMQTLIPLAELLDRPLDRRRLVLDLAEETGPRRVRPPSAIATACFSFATSNATKASILPMARPPCVRLGSALRATLVSQSHDRAGQPQPGNMTSSASGLRGWRGLRCTKQSGARRHGHLPP